MKRGLLARCAALAVMALLLTACGKGGGDAPAATGAGNETA